MRHSSQLSKTVLTLCVLPLGILVGAFISLWSDEVEATHIIARANLDGTHLERLVDVPGLAWGIALDASNGKIYWTELSDARIRRSNVDGSRVETLVTGDVFYPSAIALNIPTGKMYWTVDTGDAKIQRSNLDGTGIEDVVTTTSEIQRIGLAIDYLGNKMYWTYGEIFLNQPPDKIQRSNMDGSSIEDLINTGRSPAGIALDIDAGHMYWTEVTGGDGAIQRANLDGSSYVNVLSGLGDPFGIAIDKAAGKMYWTNPGGNRIRRANLDGSEIEDLITHLDDQLVDPRAIALDLERGKIYFTAWDTLITTTPIIVSLDLKPRKKKIDVIYLNKDKNLKVAILGEETFDALQINTETIRFGPREASPVRTKVQDYNRDGYSDLILTFKLIETGVTCGDVEARVTGETFNQPIAYISGSTTFIVEPCP